MAKDAKKNNKNKEVKNKKHFFKDFKAELKKVIWPTPKQLVNKTIAVVVVVLITAAIVFVLDIVFELISEKGINNLKSSIKNKVVVENTVENEEDIESQEENVENLETVEDESQEEKAE